MHTLKRWRYALASASALVLLNAIGSAHDMKRTSSGAVIYVSDVFNGTITAYSSSGSQIAQISNGSASSSNLPRGLTTDAQGNVYATTAGGISIYAPTLQNLIGTLSTAPMSPYDVAVDNASGVVAATGIQNSGVMFFAKGATKSCALVKSTKWMDVLFGAFDAHGNLYIVGRDPSGKALTGVVKGECSATTITTLGGGKKLVFPGGIQVAPNGNILITDQGDGTAGSTVYTYTPSTRRFGAPLYTTHLGATHEVAGISLTQDAADLWVVDTSQYVGSWLGAGTGSVSEFPYPGGGAPVATFAASSGSLSYPASTLIGAAVFPSAQP